MPQKISLVQPNFQQGPKEFNAHYLPYSVGTLWAYVKTDPVIDENLQLNHMIWRRDQIDEVAEKLSNDKVVAFSCYVWNKNYNYALAKRIKALNPDSVLIFGGPEVAIEKPDLFELHPYMDIVVKSEGEITFKNVLHSLIVSDWDSTQLSNIPGLLLNNGGALTNTGDAPRITNLDELPSPYLTGVFDKLIAETKDVEWNATLETNRGCPYMCTFCDWGSLTYNKVKKFELERVFAELEWIAKNKCGFVSITDANFGMFVERDNMIADKLIELQNEYGYPYTFSVAWAKNQKNEVVEIVKKLINSPGFNQGLTVSVQSMDLDVLENIKRKNLDQHKISDIFELCDKNNIPTYTEVILGLPGESKDTWRDNFWQLFRAGNHTGVTILHAQMLENAEMNLVQKKHFDIVSRPAYDYMSGSYNNDELQECVEVVVSTKDMPFPDMMESHIFSWFIQTFHINGLSTYIARMINKIYGIDYSEFYDKLQEYIQQDEWFRSQQDEVYNYYERWMKTGRISHPDISGIEVHGWNLVHRGTLNLHDQNKYDHVFTLLENFVRDSFDLDADVVEQLLKFNRLFVIDYYKIKDYPLVQEFDYDFLGNLLYDKPLHNKVKYKFEFNERTDISKERFLENIYFSRRRNFGKATISEVK